MSRPHKTPTRVEPEDTNMAYHMFVFTVRQNAVIAMVAKADTAWTLFLSWIVMHFLVLGDRQTFFVCQIKLLFRLDFLEPFHFAFGQN